jgi:hypothetical protein
MKFRKRQGIIRTPRFYQMSDHLVNEDITWYLTNLRQSKIRCGSLINRIAKSYRLSYYIKTKFNPF